MKIRKVRRLALSIVALFALFFAACGEDDPETDAQLFHVPHSGEIEVGRSVDLDVVFLNDDGDTYKATWSSSDDAVATVDDEGVVTGVSVGTVTITATKFDDASRTISAKLKVVESLTTSIDTSGYDGKLVWLMNALSAMPGIRVWDMATSQYLLREDHTEGRIESYYHPAVSADQSTLVYTHTVGWMLDWDVSYQVTSLNFETGEKITVPRETDIENRWRFSRYPSVTADGSVLAFSQYLAGFDEGGYIADSETDQDIAIYDGSGQPRVLDVDPAEDTCPRISADGESVIFWSDRDLEDGDFYRVSTAPGSTVERLTYTSYPGLLGIATGYLMECEFQVSEDGSRIAFLGLLADDEIGVFLMDTTTKTVERLDTDENSVPSAFSLSGDGSRLVFVAIETRFNGPIPTVPGQIITRFVGVELDGTPSSHVIVEHELVTSMDEEDFVFSAASIPIALSRDGSAIAALAEGAGVDAVNPDLVYTIVVLRFDGTDIRPVVDSRDNLSINGPARMTF